MIKMIGMAWRCFSTRPFKVLGLQQIAIGSLDKAGLTKFWGDALGIPKTGSFRSVAENVDEDILQIGTGPNAVEIDLMAPIDPERTPRVHTPALNHIGLWVDNLQACVKHLEANGIRMAPGGIRRGAAGYDVTFVHPKSTGGVLLELVQHPSPPK
jgi:lactoylglutathione lyase